MNATPRTVDLPNAPTPSVAPGKAPGPRRFDFASRLFGYDVFISFALGPPPRGSQSYASDLARRLRDVTSAMTPSNRPSP